MASLLIASVFNTGKSHSSPVISFLQLCSNCTGQGLNGISFALGTRPRLSARPCCSVMVSFANGDQGPLFSISDELSQASITKSKEAVPKFMVIVNHDDTQNGCKLPSETFSGGLRDSLENLPRRSTGESN